MKFFKLDSLLTTLLVFLTMLLFPIIFGIDFLEPVKRTLEEFKITDIVFSEFRQPELIPADTNIVLINIEPLSEYELCCLLDILAEKEPKVLAIKKKLEKSGLPDLDRILARMLGRFEKVVLSEKLSGNFNDNHYKRIEKSDSFFNRNAKEGFENLLIGQNERLSTVREFIPKAYYRDSTVFSFALEAARLFDSKAADKFINRGNSEELINYRGNYDKFFFINADEILEYPDKFDFITGKLALLGKVDNSKPPYILKDVYFTPLNEIIAGKTFPDMHGLVIHANIISMILNENYFTVIPAWISFIIAFIICYFNIAMFSYITLKNKKWYEIISLAIFVVESILILYVSIELFDSLNCEINLTIAIFAIALSIIIYEFYAVSLKPITIDLYNKLRKGKKNEKS